jgi:molecular chaperone GrpE
MTEERRTPEVSEEEVAVSPEPSAPAPAAAGSRVTDKRHTAPADPEAQLAKAKAESAQHLDDLKRLKAEFENYRKRVLKEQTSLIERASASVVERLLPILDNFELALMAAERTQDYEAMVKGVEMVFGELIDILHKEGLQRIDALGKPFDPEKHEAVLEIGDGPAEGEQVVGEVLRPGYELKGRVIRPAMVKVVRR